MQKVLLVSVDTGAASSLRRDTPTYNLPPDIAQQASAASIDAFGHLLYRSSRGATHVCIGSATELGDRTAPERFLVAATGLPDTAGWLRLELCEIAAARSR